MAAALLFGPAERWLKVDGCLDQGGRWDYDAGLCEFAEERARPGANRLPRDPAALPGARGMSCTELNSRSARAGCVALDTVQKATGIPSRVQDIVAGEGGYCIITAAAGPVLDGAGVVEVDTSGAVRSVTVTDSAACPVAAERRAGGGARPGS